MEDLDAQIALTQKKLDFYSTLGLKPVLQILPPWPARLPFDPAPYTELGRKIGAAFGKQVLAFGDFGVEQANNRPVDRPVFRPTIKGVYFSDAYYDEMYVAIHQGLKVGAPAAPVLVGNIASDPDAAALHRMYGPPVNGRFDGVIVNAYEQQLHIIQAHLAEEDKHGDTGKTVWWEESAMQASPFEGTARRYGEVEGAFNMVRTFVTIAAEAGPRLKALTIWGLATSGNGMGKSNIMIVTPLFQPRPQYAAMAVMTDFLADAHSGELLNDPNVIIYEWQRSDGPAWILWGTDKDAPLRVDAPSGHLTEMDIMGNRRDIAVVNGTASLTLGPEPVYLFGGGKLALDQRVLVNLRQATVDRSMPKLAMEITNNDNQDLSGTIDYDGPVAAGAPATFSVKAHSQSVMDVGLQGDLPNRSRLRVEARCHLPTGEVYATVLSPDFAYGTKAVQPPDLKGSWHGWEDAQVIPFGDADRGEVVPTQASGQTYKGKDDIYGHLRVMWDDQNLYLDVEASDDISLRVKGHGGGFEGDSVEFAVQPDGLRVKGSPYLEGEFYLPQDETTRFIDLRHSISENTQPESWQASAVATGHRGDMNYQVAIPWSDLGVKTPGPGKVITLAITLNDADSVDVLSAGGHRQRVRWFNGIDGGRDISRFGDVILVK